MRSTLRPASVVATIGATMNRSPSSHLRQLAAALACVMLVAGCDMIGLGGDDQPVAGEMSKQADQLKTQADNMTAV